MQRRHREKSRARIIDANDAESGEINRRELSVTRDSETVDLDTIDWLALWTLSIGVSALVLAATAFFCADDPTGAAMIMFGAAAIIAVALGVTSAPQEKS